MAQKGIYLWTTVLVCVLWQCNNCKNWRQFIILKPQNQVKNVYYAICAMWHDLLFQKGYLLDLRCVCIIWMTLFCLPFRSPKRLGKLWSHFHMAITLATTMGSTVQNLPTLPLSAGLSMGNAVFRSVKCWFHWTEAFTSSLYCNSASKISMPVCSDYILWLCVKFVLRI